MGGDAVIGGQTIAGGISYTGLEVVNVYLGSGNNTFTVESTHAGSTTIVGGRGQRYDQREDHLRPHRDRHRLRRRHGQRQQRRSPRRPDHGPADGRRRRQRGRHPEHRRFRQARRHRGHAHGHHDHGPEHADGARGPDRLRPGRERHLSPEQRPGLDRRPRLPRFREPGQPRPHRGRRASGGADRPVRLPRHPRDRKPHGHRRDLHRRLRPQPGGRQLRPARLGRVDKRLRPDPAQ